MRKRSNERAAFNASTFRRSAVLLDDPVDPFTPSNHSNSHSRSGSATGSGSDSGHGNSGNPRPPTMIERHLARAPTMPTTAYGADYSYAGLQPPYAADAHYSQFTAEQYGRGIGGGGDGAAVAAAGAYGPYASYAAQQPHPQYPQTQARYQRQPSFSGQLKNSPPAPALGQAPNLPNPFSSSVTTTAAAAVAAAHTAARTGSPSPPLVSGASQGSQRSGSLGTLLNRQPTTRTLQSQQQKQKPQSVYADIERDMMAPTLPLVVRNASPTPITSPTTPKSTWTGKGRDTLYDIADAYGGM